MVRQGRPAELELVVDPEVVARFPEVQAAALVATGLGAAGGGFAEAGRALLAQAAEAVRAAFPAPEDVVRDPRIDGWRRAIRSCGLSASDVRSSAEQLVRRLLRHDDLGAALPLVQVYCALSAKHVAPLGAYDVDRLPSSTLAMRPAVTSDSFEPLDGAASRFPLDPRVIVYGVDGEVVCWAFNHRDSARTALRDDTARAVFVAEAVTADQRAPLAAALDDLRDVLERHGAHVGPVEVADGGRPRVSLAAP